MRPGGSSPITSGGVGEVCADCGATVGMGVIVGAGVEGTARWTGIMVAVGSGGTGVLAGGIGVGTAVGEIGVAVGAGSEVAVATGAAAFTWAAGEGCGVGGSVVLPPHDRKTSRSKAANAEPILIFEDMPFVPGRPGPGLDEKLVVSFGDCALRNDRVDVVKRSDVLRWIAVDYHDVGGLARSKRTNLVFQAQALCRGLS